MRRRCSLCGGKLNGNICTECGLDNSKNDDQYVTLENSGHEESLTHVHTEEEKPYEGKTMTRENVRKAKNADKNAKKAAAKKASKNAAAGKANPVGNGYSAANASYNTAGTGYRQTGNQSYSYTSSSMQPSSRPVKKKKKFGKFLVGFVIIATFAGELGGTIIHEVQNYFEDYTYDDSDSYTEDDPYSNVQEVMPDDGEVYEADLTAGIYKGGVHIPQGTYTLTCNGGSGRVELIDSKNNIWTQYYFGDDYEDSQEEVSGFEVFPGCYVVVEDTLELHMMAENAQMDLTGISNPLIESKVVSDKFTVGKDVPAGVYDVKCVEGLGIFDYDVTVSAGYESYMGMLIGNEESGFPQELKNIVLIDGTEVDLEGLTVELTPSEWIESEEYESFYDNYN